MLVTNSHRRLSLAHISLLQARASRQSLLVSLNFIQAVNKTQFNLLSFEGIVTILTGSV